jgi:cation:H+ antiporter
MVWAILGLIGGFATIVWGADRFVTGASGLARNLGVSPLVIGLTIVGFGTSAPEMLISLEASLNNEPNLAVGNAIGSNITNIALVLGFTAIFIPLTVRSEVLKREFPVLFIIILVAAFLMMDGEFSRLDGAILLGGLGVMVYWIISVGINGKKKKDAMATEFDAEIPKGMNTWVAIFWFVLGLALLLASSKIIVMSAIALVTPLGVTPVVIGLTIIAVGSSLPELAASLMSAHKGEPDIAIGNILGSNMFNILAVMMFPALIAPAKIPPEVLSRDLGIMIGLTVVLFAMAFGFRGPGTINRWKGIILFLVFIAYQILLFFFAEHTPTPGQI